MWKSLFRLAKASRPIPPTTYLDHSPTLPPGRRVYAFGDVHGRRDLLDKLWRSILQDLGDDLPREALVVGLGDYVDRGRDSRGVLESLAGLNAPLRVVALRGNHEDVMLRFLDRPMEFGPLWLELGAAETFASYGIRVESLRPTESRLRELRAQLFSAMPVSHKRFLSALPLWHTEGDYVFVHAGIRPGIPLEQQREADLLWIRDGFADRDPRFSKVVVHGHTPVEKPEVLRFRINLDTGAYATGRLTCIVLQDSEHRFLNLST